MHTYKIHACKMLTCKMYAYNVYLTSVYFIEVHFTGMYLTGVRLTGVYLNRRESQQARTLYACVLSTGVRLSTEVATKSLRRQALSPK